MNSKSMQYPKPKLYQPTLEELRESANELSKYISPNRVLKISDSEEIKGTFQKPKNG